MISHDLTWTWKNYWRAFESIYLGIFAKSLAINGGATIACLLVGYPVVLAVVFAPPKIKTPLLIEVALPFWINILVRTYSLIAVFRSRGFLNFMLGWRTAHAR